MRWRTAARLLTVGVLGVTTTLTTMKAHNQTGAQPTGRAKQQTTKTAQLPIAEFDGPDTSDQLRKTRNNRHNSPGGPQETKARILSEDMPEASFELPLTHQEKEPALPIHISDAIVVGSTTEARAYVSGDKTNIYSEVSITVDEVFKDDTRFPLSPGAKIDGDREGGAVRFPSGKVLRKGSVAKSIPSVGSRFLFFLKYLDEGKNFSIITAYELKNGLVFPLDILSGGDNEKYLRAKESALFNEVQSGILQEKGGQQ